MRTLLLKLVLCSSMAAALTASGARATDAPVTPDRLPATAQAQQRVERYQQERLLQAAPVELVSSFYSIGRKDESFLVALNTVPYPVSFDITAVSPAGVPLPLGRYEVPPSRHLWLPLRELIGGADSGAWNRGSLRVSFLGDTGTLQAWMVIRRGKQAIEIPLQATAEAGGYELTAFWDTSGVNGTAAVYVVNAGNRPLRYRALDRGGRSPADELGPTLEPGQQARISPAGSGPRGWMRIRHDGDEGALIGTALIESTRQLTLGGLSHDRVGETTQWETARAVLDAAVGKGQTRVTLLNTSAESNHARVLAISPITGRPLAEWTRDLDPGEVLSVPLTPRLAHLLGDLTGQEIRVRVEAREPGLLVTGHTTMRDGEIVDVSFFPLEDAHAAGSYPVPSLARFDVDLTLANLDPEDSQVVAQFFWDGGTYAFGPVTIPGGISYRLSVADLIDHHQPDLLGRTLPADLPGGFVKWKVQSGSRRLLGRTEVRFKDSGDRVGFNCFGCCYEVPFGSVEPVFVEFDPGQSPLFQSCVSYDTCSGTMGPYQFSPTSMTVPSPFSWDGVNVSASSEAEAELSFFGLEEEHQPNCFTINVPIDGLGKADSCKPLLRKPHNPLESWSNTQACNLQDSNCSRCKQCCAAQKGYRLCKNVHPDLVESEYLTCVTACEIEHC